MTSSVVLRAEEEKCETLGRVCTASDQHLELDIVNDHVPRCTEYMGIMKMISVANEVYAFQHLDILAKRALIIATEENSCDQGSTSRALALHPRRLPLEFATTHDSSQDIVETSPSSIMESRTPSERPE